MKTIAVLPYFLILIGAILPGVTAKAQTDQLFPSRHGTLSIHLFSGDKELNMGNNQVVTIIKKETKEIIIRLNPSNLDTKTDSLNQELAKKAYPDIVFTGEMILPFFEPKSPPEDQFLINGDLKIGNIIRNITLQASVINQGGRGPSVYGQLYLHIDLDFIDFELENLQPLFSSPACIEILHPLVN